MVSPGAPLLVSPKPSWHKLSWMANFIAAIPRCEENTVTTARLAIEARQHLRRMAGEEGIDFDAENRSILHVYDSKKGFEAAARVTALLARGGLERRAVTPPEMRSIEPVLEGTVYGGFYTPSDFTGDIHKFTHGLALACERHGATMRLSTEVLSAEADANGVSLVLRSTEPTLDDARDAPETQRYDKVVVCGGVMSRKLGEAFGDRINVYPVKGYSITVQRRPGRPGGRALGQPARRQGQDRDQPPRPPTVPGRWHCGIQWLQP